MSFEEKGTWVYLVVTLGTYLAYVGIILGRADGAPLTEVPYVATMLWTVGIAVALSILGYIAVAIAKPSEADKSDARDRDIKRFGEYVGGTVLGIAMVLPLGLAMAEVDPFWIANAMYAAFTLSALVGTCVRLVAYRRGL